MAPFDFPLTQNDLMSGEARIGNPLRVLDRLASTGLRTKPELEMQTVSFDAVAQDQRRMYSLLDGSQVRASSGLPAVNAQTSAQRGSTQSTSVQSITTTDYAEFILQLLDKNSFLSSIMVVCAYILIFRAL